MRPHATEGDAVPLSPEGLALTRGPLSPEGRSLTLEEGASPSAVRVGGGGEGRGDRGMALCGVALRPNLCRPPVQMEIAWRSHAH